MTDFKPQRDTQPMQTTTWTVAMARNALQDCEMGYLHRAALLADAMTRDDRIAATLRSRNRALLGLPRKIVPNGETRNARKIAEALEQDFEIIAPEDTIAALMRWCVLLGVSLAEQRWERHPQTGRWCPRLKVWHPQFLSYRWDTRSWWLATQDGPLEIVTGTGQWLILQLGSERPWMEGLVRELAIPYLIRQFAIRDWARYSEIHGLATKIAKVPSSSSADERDLFFSSISKLGREALVKMVQPADATTPGFSFELLEAKANTWTGFQGLIKQLDSSIAISVLGQNLTTEVSGGSRSAAEVHERKALQVTASDVALLENALETQVINHYTAINYGASIPAPTVDFAFESPEDEKLRAETLGIIADVLPKLQAAGVDITPILVQYDLTPVSQTPPATLLSRLMAGQAKLTAADGFTNGQLYADALADGLLEQNVLEPDLQQLQKIIANATDYDDLRAKLLKTYAKMNPDELANLLEQAILLGDLAGQHAVLEDNV